MADSSPVDPGATPVTSRALAPDLARGGMLLLIALANVHVYLYGHPLGVRGYPRDVEGVDRVVALLQMTFVDGRAYPLFGLLFGYGIVQLAWRRSAVGLPGVRGDEAGPPPGCLDGRDRCRARRAAVVG